MSHRLDTTHWPLVTLVLPADVATLDLDQLTEDQNAIFAREGRYVSLVDGSAVSKFPNGVVRRHFADWTERNRPRLRRWQAADSLIVPNSLGRGMLTAVHWLSPPAVPTKVVGTMEEAIVFLREHLADEGLDTAPLDSFAAARGIARVG